MDEVIIRVRRDGSTTVIGGYGDERERPTIRGWQKPDPNGPVVVVEVQFPDVSAEAAPYGEYIERSARTRH